MTKVILGLLTLLAASVALYLVMVPTLPDGLISRSMLTHVWIPTALMALVVGMLHSSSGLLIQISLNNDFASPATLGIASGALLGAVVAQIGFPEVGFVVIWLGAFIGALLLSVVILLVSRLFGGGQVSIILVGMALGLGAGAVSSILLLYFENQTDGLFLWGSGQVLQTSINPIKNYAPLILATLLASMVVLPKLSLFQLGETNARALGVSVALWRWLILLVAVLQASLATAMVGLVAFVGLMAPHLARSVYALTNKQRNIVALWLLSVLIGALIVLAAEWCSRSLLFIGYRLPTGAFTTLIGAPFFIYLLFRRAGRVSAASDSGLLHLRAIVELKPYKTMFLLAMMLVFSLHFWADLSTASTAVWVNYRIVMAAIAGVALAVAGVVLQSLFRNPMASPDISGVSAFAVLLIACVLVIYPAAPQWVLSGASLVGAALVMLLLSWGIKQQLNVAQLALFGIVISAFAGTATHILLTFGSSTASVTLMWLSGTTYGASLEQIIPFLVVVTVTLVSLLPFLRSLDLFSLGEIVPKTLGVDVNKHRVALLLGSAFLTAISVSYVGAISFIGLLAPHCARLLGVTRHAHLLPTAAFIGATLMVWADGLGRTVTAPNEIAAGLMVSIIGSGYFLLLILVGYRKRTYANT
ncbi:iron ABC transporter permease [Vibrio sp. SCSIO 43136]|uniref:iron ABC transporter permease n=1 Tax=Vibrio sp. SCSIO 43136 TaxID=2819101 RepID=UPI0020755ED6|nr:iron ABC transporter permease [Vibrio sp. SCSIO 43136]USD67621.1 iron ABC transporter permease [Vibrio sp. SCSIO 43136]